MNEEEVIEALREAIRNSQHFKSEANQILFDTLENIYNQRIGLANVVVDRYDNLNQLVPYLNYKRLTTVYNRKIYNKFLVPIWAAVMDDDMSVGYVVYPRMESLSDVLEVLKNLGADERDNKLNEVLRLCFASIALAIESLHTAAADKREEYIHGDICIGNVRMCVKRETVDGQASLKYDDARLLLTPWPTQFTYHHDRTLGQREMYMKRHDWHSYGIYILEVLHLLFGEQLNLHFPHARDGDYVAYAAGLRPALVDLHLNDGLLFHIQGYIDIAERCLLVNDDAVPQVDSYEVPETFWRWNTHVPHENLAADDLIDNHILCFDYGVNEWTAQLLWQYKVSRPEDYKSYKHFIEKCDTFREGQHICQACLLIPTGYSFEEKFETEHSRAGNTICRPRCMLLRRFYCSSCYTNGERLFCAEHGTTSPALGHCASYALFLFGDDGLEAQVDGVINRFEYDAKMLANAMRHRFICGMPEANIHIEPVYERENDGRVPEDLLRAHCENMCRRIHPDRNACADHTWFVFYSGFGGRGNQPDGYPGDWKPLPTDNVIIERPIIARRLNSVQDCDCASRCVEISSILDMCYSTRDTADLHIARDVVTHIIPRYTTPPRDATNTNTVTNWFSQLLRSLFHVRCCTNDCNNCTAASLSPNHRCPDPSVARRNLTSTCRKISGHIMEEHYNIFIDIEGLVMHTKHCTPQRNYPASVILNPEPTNMDHPLAYFNPQGVHLRVFPFQADGFVIELDFACDITIDGVKKSIMDNLERDGDNRDVLLSLLTNMTDGHSEYELVTDERINYIIGSSALFYHVITEPVEISLKLERPDGHPMTEKIQLELNESDLSRMVDKDKGSHLLPNIYSYITHSFVQHRQKPNIKDRTNIRSCFMLHLGVADMEGLEWAHVENKAKKYWSEGNTDRFHITEYGTPMMSVVWQMGE